MKTIYNFNTTKLTMLFFCLVMIASFFLTSCKNDETILSDPYFSIEGDPTNLSATTAGIVQNYVVRSNRNWQVVAQDKSENWVKPFPKGGQDDGIFKFTVKKNTTPYNRTTNFAFVSAGEEQAVFFTVNQESSAPYLIFTDTLETETDTWEVQGRANRFKININSNVNSTYTIADSWLTVATDSSHYLILEASENPDQEFERATNINFIVEDFPSLNQSLIIKQACFSPAINISNINSLNELDFTTEGDEIKLDVDANVDWNYVVSTNDWLTISEKTETSVTLKASTNATGIQRSVKINFGFEEYSGGKEITVIQYAGIVLLSEDFNWVSGISYNGTNASDIIYCYKTGPRYDYWEEAGIDLSALSWTTSLINNTTSFYAANGYVKLGKTKNCADIIFNKIANIQGEVKLKVTFKAAAYVTASGNQNDDRLLQVEALNAGIPDVEVFDINNFPEKGNHNEKNSYNTIWEENRTWGFVISKATSETQIRFLAGKAVGSTAATNRISIDDIKIEY